MYRPIHEQRREASTAQECVSVVKHRSARITNKAMRQKTTFRVNLDSNIMPTKLPGIPISLYIHIPWCIRKCPYCDFNSHPVKNSIPEKTYIQALLADLQASINVIEQRPLHSIFIGGGTPSLFSATSIIQLIHGIHKLWPIHDSVEITLEANPGTFEQQRFRDFLNAGINRLSIGLQSLNDKKLQALGRIHSTSEAINAVKTAQDVGFTNINLDIMFGLPQQTIEQALSDVEQALTLQPKHFSWYQLTLEPNTLFYRQPPSLPKDDTIFLMQQQGQTLLTQQGFQHYEVSAYSMSGAICQHNLNYWQFGDYIGIGAGAHGKITSKQGNILRTQKLRSPISYLKAQQTRQSLLANQYIVPSTERPFEFMLNALRLQQPLSYQLFEQRTGLTRNDIEPILKQAQQDGLIELDQQGLKKTTLGQHFLDDLVVRFMCD